VLLLTLKLQKLKARNMWSDSSFSTILELLTKLLPSIFDAMEHYMIYLAYQIFVLHPIYMHYMYPYERHMVVMKGNIRNRTHPEGSMLEGYTTEEIIECYADYIKDEKPIGVPIS
jgi:hypothetical protein